MIPQKISELVRSTGDVAFAVSTEGVIVAWNRAASDVFGITESSAVGRFCRDVLLGIDECGPVCSPGCAVRQSVQAQRPVSNFDVRVATSTGRHWYNVSVLIFRETGSPDTYALHVARSVDLRKRLEVLMRDFVLGESTVGEGVKSFSRTAIENAALSDRETDVLRLLSQGCSTIETARQLGISRATVNNHAQHAMAKLDAHSRLEAIRKAIHGRLI